MTGYIFGAFETFYQKNKMNHGHIIIISDYWSRRRNY